MTHPLPSSESLTVEFKSDRSRLSDAELVEAVVCLANTEGGELWLGVEDDSDHRIARRAPRAGRPDGVPSIEWAKGG